MEKVLCIIAKRLSGSQLENGWMVLFKAGWGELADGPRFFADQQAFDLVAAAAAEYGNDIVFDYEHQTLKDVKAPAAGWIKELAWEDGVGIKARVEWTRTAATHLEEKEYRYFSPVFYIRKSDRRVCGLHSSALTNTPKTKHLTPILAKLGLNTIKEESMDRTQLITALGLKEDATDADILAAVARAGVPLPVAEKSLTTVAAALGLEDTADASAVVASINVLKQEGKNSVPRSEFDALKKEIAEKKAGDAVAAAMATGKIAPDQKDWALDYAMGDPKGFDTFVAKAPVVVPVNKLPGKKTRTADGELTEADLAVAAQMGIDPEDIKKYGMEVKHG